MAWRAPATQSERNGYEVSGVWPLLPSLRPSPTPPSGALCATAVGEDEAKRVWGGLWPGLRPLPNEGNGLGINIYNNFIITHVPSLPPHPHRLRLVNGVKELSDMSRAVGEAGGKGTLAFPSYPLMVHSVPLNDWMKGMSEWWKGGRGSSHSFHSLNSPHPSIHYPRLFLHRLRFSSLHEWRPTEASIVT